MNVEFKYIKPDTMHCKMFCDNEIEINKKHILFGNESNNQLCSCLSPVLEATEHIVSILWGTIYTSFFITTMFWKFVLVEMTFVTIKITVF